MASQEIQTFERNMVKGKTYHKTEKNETQVFEARELLTLERAKSSYKHCL